MRSHTHSQTPAPSAQSAYQFQIPWWDDLDPAVIAQLEIPALSSLTLPLQQPLDVVVIGAGVAGLSAALSARATGAQVLLLEKVAMPGYGATGRNAGILSAGINMGIADLPPDSPDLAFWPETTAVLLSLVDEARQPGSILQASLTGALSLAESAHAARQLAREVRARVAVGVRAELWTPEQVTEATAGRLNVESVIQTMWLPDEGRIHPLTLLAHLAQQARAAGVILAGRAPVSDYQEQGNHSNGGHRWHITLADGTTITARGLISAVGPTARPNARIYAQAFAANLPDSFPLFWDASPYTYADFRPGNGRLGISGGRYGKAGVTRYDARYHKRLSDVARHWLPELTAQEPIATWAVDLEVAPDMVPQLRKLGNVAPGVAIESLGALGVLPGIVLGRRAGKLIAGQG
jgi:glycine/D-amino acid oxidase-like deaminating enzyme